MPRWIIAAVRLRTLARPGVALALCACALALSSTASAYTSFTAYISSTTVWTYSTPNRLDMRVSASYRDYDCSPSYECDRNVLVELELRRGYSSYGPVMARTYGETGQYGSTVRGSFRIPSCRFIPRYHTQNYTVTMTAVAPDGREKTSRRTVYQRSCR
jgi:hypothetical protein